MNYLVFALVLVGHFGLHVAFYNRFNATGLGRRKLKVIERLVALECFLLPLWMLQCVGRTEVPLPMQVYGAFCLMCIIVLGIPWLIYRPIFGVNWINVDRTVRVVDVAAELDQSPGGTRWCRFNAALPMNQIFELAMEEKALPVVGLPDALVGLRIAHISDIHLTGHMLPSYYRYVAEQLMEWRPEMVCLTGDIVDKSRCLDWLGDCLSEIQAPAGCYFILGNHDTRISDPNSVRDRMIALGWTDVGGKSIDIQVRDFAVSIAGNELPWFGPAPKIARDIERFRLLLSHSPDQINWARQNHFQLMLAGHTHGGHGRLPLVGPLLSPSYHGSRFASGEFYLPPTTMHVTRGIFGTHLQRINCRPELSLLTLGSGTMTERPRKVAGGLGDWTG